MVDDRLPSPQTPPTKPTLDRRDAGFLVTLFLATLPIYALDLNDPFVHHGDLNGPLFGNIAANYLKFGVFPLGTSGPSLDHYQDYRRHLYINHPPLPSLMTVVAFKIGGDRDLSYRVYVALFAWIGIVLFLCLSRSLVVRPAAWIATGALSITPLYGYYMGVVGVWTTMFPAVFLMMIGYRAWLATRRSPWLALMVTGQVLACASDWEGYYAAVVVAAHAFWTRRAWAFALALFGINVLCFSAFLGWLHALSPPDHSFVEQFLTLGAARAGGLSFWDQLKMVGFHAARHATVPLILTAAAGLVVLWKQRRHEWAAFVACWLFFGLHHVVFPRYAAFHDFLTMPVLPFLALSAALAVLELWRRMRFGPTLAVLLGIGFVALSARVLHSRLTHAAGPDSIRYDLCMSIKDHTHPETRVLVISRPPIWHFSYYPRRYIELFEPDDRMLVQSYSAPHTGGVTYESLIEMIRTGQRVYDVIVVARLDLLVTEHPRFSGNSELARWWHALDAESDAYRGLESLGVRTESHRGYVFIWLR